MDQNLLDYVKGALQRRKGSWPAISLAADVPYDTLSKIARGAIPDPGVLKVQRLADHLRELDVLDPPLQAQTETAPGARPPELAVG